jgi:hypothetical protein
MKQLLAHYHISTFSFAHLSIVQIVQIVQIG